MRLRFEVNRAEAFRQGIDLRKSTVTIHVNPARITPEQKSLIAARLDGIDVLQLHYDAKAGKPQKTYYWSASGRRVAVPVRIQAELPNFDSLMQAIEANQAEVAGGKKRLQKILLDVAHTAAHRALGESSQQLQQR